MALKEKVQEEAVKYLAVTLVGIVLFVLAAVWILPNELLPTQVIEKLGEYSTGKTLLRAILLIGGLVAWIVYLRPCLIFDKRIGAFRDFKTGLYYCTRCRSEKKIKTPLRELPDNFGWQCDVCNRGYRNPDYVEPIPPPPKRNNRI